MVMDTYCEALKKLLVKDGQATPRTFARIIENLPFSRYTLIKHLKEMETKGLVSKSVIARTSRGRPKLLYHPTDLLLKGEATIPIPFSILSENCIHRNGKKCGKIPSPCELQRCPLLDKNRQ